MTVTTITNRSRQSGNGAITDFDFSFKVFNATDLIIYKIDTTDDSSETLVLDTDYTVTLNTVTLGGKIIIIGDVFTSDEDILILRENEFKQEANMPVADTFPAESVENALDLNMMLSQQLDEIVDRSITLAVTSSTTGLVIPEPVALRAIMFDTAGTQLKVSTYNPDDTGDASVSATAAAASAAAAAASASANNLPTIAVGDAGKLLEVNATGDGYDLTTATIATIEASIMAASILENRTDDPSSPVSGQMWLRTDLP